MDTQANPEEQEKSLATYAPTPYSQTVWPVLETAQVEVDSFQPATFEKMESQQVFIVDPMFAVFTEEERSQASATLEQEYTAEETAPVDQNFAPAGEEMAADEGGLEFVQDQPLGEVLIEPDESTNEQPASEADVSSGGYGFDQAAVEQALEQAYAKGCSDTREEVELYKRQLEEQYTVLWEDMQLQLAQGIQSHERSAVELAFQIAKRMVGSAVENQRECVVTVIQEAMQAAAGSEIKCIRVSPQDYEFLSLNAYGERIKIHGEGKLSFVSDETVRHGCIVETSSGQVDFDLDQAWARMHHKVFQGS